MKQRIFYAIGLGGAVVVALFAFLPALRHFIWWGVFWGIAALAVIAAVGVIVNIVSVMYSMYTGYSSSEGPDVAEKRASPPTWTAVPVESYGAVSTEKVLPFRQAVTGEGIEGAAERLDAIGELYSVERALSNLQSTPVFEAFGDMQKRECNQLLADVRALMGEISRGSAKSKVAS